MEIMVDDSYLDIAKTKEYQDYLMAKFIYRDVYLGIDSTYLQTISGDGYTYQVGNTSVLDSLYRDIDQKYKYLVQKYPRYGELSYEQQNNIMYMAVEYSSELYDKVGVDKKAFAKTKTADRKELAYKAHQSIELIKSKYNYNSYNTSTEALSKAAESCYDDKSECCAYIFKDYSAIVIWPKYVDPKNSSKMLVPVLNLSGELTPIIFAHYHPWTDITGEKINGTDKEAYDKIYNQYGNITFKIWYGPKPGVSETLDYKNYKK